MESYLLNKKNNKEDNITFEKLIKPPYFIEIIKSNDKKIKIPCSNEAVAKKILAAYSNNNSNSKVSLV